MRTWETAVDLLTALALSGLSAIYASYFLHVDCGWLPVLLVGSIVLLQLEDEVIVSCVFEFETEAACDIPLDAKICVHCELVLDHLV